MRLSHLLPLLAGAALSGTPALSQDSWEVSASAYLWFPETTTALDTRFGTVSGELGRSEAIDALELGIMGTMTARNGRWSVVGDFFYLDLASESSAPRQVLFSHASTGIRLASAAVYGLYAVVEQDGVTFDLGGGARLMSADIDLTLRGVAVPDRHASISDTWIDPLIAARVSYEGDGPWRASLWVDGGGFGIGEASDNTWQVVALATYRLNDRWSLSGGWRYLSADREYNGLPYDLELSGPVFGGTYLF